MNTFMNIIGELGLKKHLVILIPLLLGVNTLIQSQNTLSTEITYEKLTEFAKYVVFKDSASILFQQFKVELITKDKIIGIKQQKIDVLTLSLAKSDSISMNKSHLLEISDVKLKSQKAKKWQWLGVGAAGGIILALLLNSK